jgi:arsenite methyltransferase
MAPPVAGNVPAMSPSGSRGSYGIDAPTVVVGLTAGAVALAVVAVLNAVSGNGLWSVSAPAAGAAFFAVSDALFLYATRRGKFRVWSGLLDGLRLEGSERVLDVGCGRGAVLLAVAGRLPRGRAVGVDRWRSVDQSGNAVEVTRRNATAEGVADRVALHTGDATALPFATGAFDVVVSSLVIHNIKPAAQRRRAVAEAFRVLRPGGRLVIADISHAPDYARDLEALGATTVQAQPLGWRLWFGGPWMATIAVTAERPIVG